MRRCKWLSGFLLPVIFLLLLSACAPVLGTGSDSLTPLQVLQNSSKAMKQLKSAHFDLNMTSNLLGNIPGLPTTSTSSTNQVNVNITGKGDESLPDKQSLQIVVNQNVAGKSISLSEMLLGNKVYVQNAQGQWYVLDRSVVESTIGILFSGINVDPTTLLGLIQNGTLIDHGTELLNGQQLRHISAVLSKAAFEQILTSNPQLNNLFGKQNVTNVIDSAKTLQASIDLWIDETNFYVHRVELRFDLDENLSVSGSSATPAPGLAAHFDSITDLSNFNKPVTITPPTSAIPISNPIAIFGSGK